MEKVFLFPGQGSQKVGMAADIFAEFALARTRFAEAADVLGRDIAHLCFEGPLEELTATQNTQPALFTVTAVIADILKANGVTPTLALGHSLGEYAALYCAGVYSFADGLRLVERRGKLMAEAGKASSGTMAAVVGLSKEKIREVLATLAVGIVVPANENSPDQTVISGEVSAVKQAAEALSAAGAKRVIQLPVSGAFHSPLMQSAADEFAAVLAGVSFSVPTCPVVSNVTAKAETDPFLMRDLLVKQLVSPVRWVDSMSFLASGAHTACVEAGPGNVLKGLARKCQESIDVITCDTAENLYSLLRSN